MPDPRDFLPQPPWEGPPIPKALIQESMEDLEREHPTWTDGNIWRLYHIKDYSDRLAIEVLLSITCAKCGREMGEHTFAVSKFICPR